MRERERGEGRGERERLTSILEDDERALPTKLQSNSL